MISRQHNVRNCQYVVSMLAYVLTTFLDGTEKGKVPTPHERVVLLFLCI